jgi:hypothetical protein
MEMWDQDAIDLVQPGFIEFGDDGLGHFGFIAVNGELDCRDAAGRRSGVEFSWEGNDDTSPASGRGWAVLNPDGSLDGHIYFHLGDDSSFRAAPFDAEPLHTAKSAPGSGRTREAGLRCPRHPLRSGRAIGEDGVCIGDHAGEVAQPGPWVVGGALVPAARRNRMLVALEEVIDRERGSRRDPA